MQPLPIDIKPYEERFREQVVSVWEKSVRATRDFVKPEDIEYFKSVVVTTDLMALGSFKEVVEGLNGKGEIRLVMPNIYIIAGCNGAGKTTAAKTLLPEVFGISEFVNADAIAAGLSPFNPEGVAFQAGRLMLERIHELAEQKSDFAFETTLATRSYVSMLKRLSGNGYSSVLVFFYLPDPTLAIQRIAERVRLGGHYIQDEVVNRRYERGLSNFFRLYRPIVNSWYFMDNAVSPSLIASGSMLIDSEVKNPDIWNRLKAKYD